MALEKRGEIWYFAKRINGQRFRESTGFADKKSAERRASEIEHDIRAGIHGWKSTIPSFADWWAVYRTTYTPQKSAKNRDAQIVAHFLPQFGAKRLDEITKSDIVRYLSFRKAQMTASRDTRRDGGSRRARSGMSADCCKRSSNGQSKRATTSGIRSAVSNAARTRRARAC